MKTIKTYVGLVIDETSLSSDYNKLSLMGKPYRFYSYFNSY